jgi:hypothetical protein
MWLTLLEIGKFCFGENYKGSVITDFNSKTEIFVTALELQEIINNFDDDEYSIMMARKSKILKRILNKAQIENKVRQRKSNSVRFFNDLI